MTDLVTVAGSAVVCGGAGLLVPWLIGRLPEPPPDPWPQDGVELTAAQQARADEGPKELYADLAARPSLAVLAAMISAVVGGLIGLVVGRDWLLLLLLPLAPVGTALGIVDLRTRFLPSPIVVPATLAAILYGLVAWPVDGDLDSLVRGAIGLAVARSLFWVLWFVHQAGMGFGDVRLAALLGFVLAYVGWPQFAVGMYAGFLVFAIPGLVLALVRWDRKLLKATYPFGPAMLAGALLGLLVGEVVVARLTGG